MKEEKTTQAERDLHLATLATAVADVAALRGGLVEFAGLPIIEWAGPGYALAALFDPHVLTAKLRRSTIHLECAELRLPGLDVLEARKSQKEAIRFQVCAQRQERLNLPMIWGGVGYHVLRATPAWSVQATVGEFPALLVQEGQAVFAFNPLRVIHRHLNMADPSTTARLTDLVVKAVLAASGIAVDLPADDLRRDFHAAGVSALMICQLYRIAGKTWEVAAIEPDLLRAAQAFCAGDRAAAKAGLGSVFKRLEAARRAVVATPVYFMLMPHGGILFPGEGYAEYDWPEAAAQVLNLYLDWTERCGIRFAPDIGAGTLEEFAKFYPATIARMRKAWAEGRMEFVNGSYSQPYNHVCEMWDQDQQFAVGLRTFSELFGRRPPVFAAQEMAFHPAMPDLLAKHGFIGAIHRAQNLGWAPADQRPLLTWRSANTGATIRTLPAHPLRSERRGGETWRHLPVMLTSQRNAGLPFIAITNTMDQTFIDIYTEEVIRSNTYAPVWGEFVTPSRFFELTRDVAAPEGTYALDQYSYDLDLAGNSIHGNQTGGYSSQHAFIFAESRKLRPRIAAGEQLDRELKLLLNQQAHDSYIIPYFPTGYFMEGSLTDYAGPRYHCDTDLPRGTKRTIRDAVGYPRTFSDRAPAVPGPVAIDGLRLNAGGARVEIDRVTGAVASINGSPAGLGQVMHNDQPFAVERIASADGRLHLSGSLPGFPTIRIAYCIADGWLYGEVSADVAGLVWNSTRVCWGDCVHLAHAKPAGAEVVRTVSGVVQPTVLDRFHSLGELAIGKRRLRHGGNIFFRQTGTAVHNRLWCYDEFSDTFWWAVAIA